MVPIFAYPGLPLDAIETGIRLGAVLSKVTEEELVVAVTVGAMFPVISRIFEITMATIPSDSDAVIA